MYEGTPTRAKYIKKAKQNGAEKKEREGGTEGWEGRRTKNVVDHRSGYLSYSVGIRKKRGEGRKVNKG